MRHITPPTPPLGAEGTAKWHKVIYKEKKYVVLEIQLYRNVLPFA